MRISYSSQLMARHSSIFLKSIELEKLLMTTVANPLDLIDSELAKAAAPRPVGNKKPIFLFFKEGHKALFRPLADLSGCVILKKHDKFHADQNLRVNSICACEIDQECTICAKVPDDRKLAANLRFYLPIYVYQVIDSKTGQKVTYKERDEHDQEVEKPISGVRVLELSSFGTISDILKYFRGYMKEDDEPPMIERDFAVSQVGAGQTKSFSVLSKTPKPIDPRIANLIPTQERLRTRILEALPPVTPVAATPAHESIHIVSDATSTEELDVDDTF
jgi:hypothetical protein